MGPVHVVEPTTVVTAGVAVLLHGHGGRPEELLDIAVVLAERTGRRIVLPSGTEPTDGDGFAWWEAGDLARPAGDPEAAAAALMAALGVLLAAEPQRQTALIGFSQGGALACLAGAGFAATIIVAGFLPDGISSPFVAGQRLLVVHGEADDVVDPLHGRRLARVASRAGADVTTVWHDGGHEWTTPCTEAVLAFLAE